MIAFPQVHIIIMINAGFAHVGLASQPGPLIPIYPNSVLTTPVSGCITQIQSRQATTVGTSVGIKNTTLIHPVCLNFLLLRITDTATAKKVVTGTPINIMYAVFLHVLINVWS